MLEDLRKKIDEIDEKIVNLINERAKIAHEIAKTKAKEGSPLYRPDRESQIYEKIRQINTGHLDNESLCNIYREIMSATLKLEGAPTVAFFGSVGSFTHQAAIKKFGHSLEFYAQKTISDVFDVVSRKHHTYGVVPVENSTEGIVNQTLDNFLNYDLRIYAEIRLAINHHLLSYAKELNQIRFVHTHTQAYAQCRRWLSQNLPNAEFVEEASTSEAVQKLAHLKDEFRAAIGSQLASEIYQVPILVSNIQDFEKNFTRFFVIGHDQSGPSGNDRTLISFALPNEAGALYKVLKPLARLKVNLTSIESRPMKSNLWSYVFYLDMDGHYEDKKIRKALFALQKKTIFLRLLGSYPVDTTVDI